MNIAKFRNIVFRIIPVLVIVLSAVIASAQPGGHLAPNAHDTIKTSSGNRATHEIFDRNGQLIQSIHLKNGEKNGFTEIYQNGVLVEKTRYKKGKRNGDSDKFYANGMNHISAQYKNDLLSGKYKEYYISGLLPPQITRT